MKKKVSVNSLTDDQFREIMESAAKKKNIRLVKSEQVNMRLAPDLIFVAKELAHRAKKPMTTFLTELLADDLRRMWKVVK